MVGASFFINYITIIQNCLNNPLSTDHREDGCVSVKEAKFSVSVVFRNVQFQHFIQATGLCKPADGGWMFDMKQHWTHHPYMNTTL